MKNAYAVAELRVLVGYLGELADWWDSQFFAPTSNAFLEPIFGRSIEQAKYDKPLLTGTRYLLLKNAMRLSDAQQARLQHLLAANTNLNAVYTLNEQPQQMWRAPGNR